MKVLLGSLILASAGAAYAQQAPTAVTRPATPGTHDAKVVAELAAAVSQLGGVKNAPFSAEEFNETVQVLADGNRIVRSSTNNVYRNSEGRLRRDMQGGAMGGVLGSTYVTGQGVSIVDPVVSQSVILDTHTKVARVAELHAATELVTIARQKELSHADQAKMEGERAQAVERLRAITSTSPVAVGGQGLTVVSPAPAAAVGSGVGNVYTLGQTSKYETRTEELGTRDFEGVSAEGRRTVTTIPAGAIGNERPIETTYERWYSKELGMVVYSKRSDPRTGETTYQLRNIVRSEPDPALFTIPKEYRKVSSGGTVYSPSKKMADAKPVSPKLNPTYVKNDRP